MIWHKCEVFQSCIFPTTSWNNASGVLSYLLSTSITPSDGDSIFSSRPSPPTFLLFHAPPPGNLHLKAATATSSLWWIVRRERLFERGYALHGSDVKCPNLFHWVGIQLCCILILKLNGIIFFVTKSVRKQIQLRISVEKPWLPNHGWCIFSLWSLVLSKVLSNNQIFD